MRPSCEQLLERQPRDLPAHAVEAGQHDRAGRVVDDEVDAGEGLEHADVAALAADDPALHVVGGELHDRDGRLGGVRRRQAAASRPRGCCARGDRPRAWSRPRSGAGGAPPPAWPRPRSSRSAAAWRASPTPRRCARARARARSCWWSSRLERSVSSDLALAQLPARAASSSSLCALPPPFVAAGAAPCSGFPARNRLSRRRPLPARRPES